MAKGKGKGNAVVNIYENDREQLRRFALERGLSVRAMFEEVLDVYNRSKGPEARRLTLEIDVDVFKGSFNASLKVKPYKPWLGREDADDLEVVDLSEVQAQIQAQVEKVEEEEIEEEEEDD